MAGRGESLEALEAVFAGVSEGKHLVLLEGEAGIGKTRLAAEFAAGAASQGAVVLYGRADDGARLPYQPFAEALGHYFEHSGREAVDELGGEVADHLARFVPGVDTGSSAGAPGSLGGEADEFLLFGAIAAALERISQRAPLVLVLDDLHWAGEGTHRALRYVVTGPSQIAGLVLATYRDTDLRGKPWAEALAELEREPEVSRITLGALSSDDALELVEGIAEGGVAAEAADLAPALLAESGGNPLFMTELVRTLLDAGSDRAEGRGIGDRLRALQVPRTVMAAIAQRTAELGSRARDTLTAAAVFGQEFDPELVERALGLDPEESRSTWEASERAGLTIELDGGSFGFTHPLVARTLYDGLGSRRRGELHRRAAGALEEASGEEQAAELARHWSLAVPADVDRSLLWAARAGRRALEQLDGSAAAEWFRRALELHRRSGSDDERARCELLIGLGTALRQIGDADFRETLLEAARLADRLGDRESLVRAALLTNLGIASVVGRVDDERAAVLNAALRAVGEDDSRERAELLATLAMELTFSGDWEGRIKLSDESVAIARRLGDRATLARVLNSRAVITWRPSTLEGRLAGLSEALEIADELGDGRAQFLAAHWRFTVLVQSGDLASAQAAGERATEQARKLGDPTSRWISTYDRGTLALVAGRLEEADRLSQEAFGIASRGQFDSLPLFTSLLTTIRYEQGRLPELLPLLAKVVSENPGIPGFRALLALAHVEGDLREEARKLLAVDLASGFAEVPVDSTWLGTHMILAQVAGDLESRSAAAPLYELLVPWEDQVAYAGAGAWGFVSRAVGRLATVLERFDDAEPHLDAAVDGARRAGAPIWVARAQLDRARLLLARDVPGDRERAGESLGEAITLAARAGAANLERRARSVREFGRAIGVAASGAPSGQRLRLAANEEPPGDAGRSTGVEGKGSLGSLERTGDYWLLRVDEREVRLRDRKGVRYLATLLSRPGTELHAAQLQMGATAPAQASPSAAAEAGLTVSGAGAGDAGELLDPEAKRRYRERIEQLRDEIDEGERFNDPERASRAREELEFVGRELASAVGIGGRDRQAASNAERARVNVTRALRGTVRRIADHDAKLGGHLEASIRTGSFCCYEPPAGQEIEWTTSEDHSA